MKLHRSLRTSIFILLLLCAAALSGGAGGRAVLAQDSPPPKLLTFTGTDNALSYYLEIGPIFAIIHTDSLSVTVSGGTPLPTTGTVVFRSGAREYPAQYAGPIPGFEAFAIRQINLMIPPDEFTQPIAGYLRVCDLAGNCVNSTGATLRKAGQ